MPAAYTSTYTARTPYLTPAEYLAAPTGVDANDLVPGGTTQANTAALVDVIGRASSWADQICHQVLACTQETEVKELSTDRFGSWRVAPTQWPAVDLLAATWQPAGSTFVSTLSVGTAIIEKQRITIPGTGLLGSSSVGPLQFGAGGFHTRGWLTFTYLAGYPNTTLSGNVSAGATSITVTSALGIYGQQTGLQVTTGTNLTIYDGALTEQVQVTAVNGSTLTLSAALVNAHNSGVSVSAFPAAIKQAVISLTSALIKTRGSEALVMSSLTSGPTKTDGLGEPGAIEDVEVAVDLLDPFRSLTA